MIRRLLVLVVAGVSLSACGTQSAQSAARHWATQSNVATNTIRLRHDVVTAGHALNQVTASAATLHTICGVLDFDLVSANASLPTPDAQLSTLLASAYNTLGNGASVCYHAAGSAPRRARALGYLRAGLGILAEGEARLAVLTQP